VFLKKTRKPRSTKWIDGDKNTKIYWDLVGWKQFNVKEMIYHFHKSTVAIVDTFFQIRIIFFKKRV